MKWLGKKSKAVPVKNPLYSPCCNAPMKWITLGPLVWCSGCGCVYSSIVLFRLKGFKPSKYFGSEEKFRTVESEE